MQKDGAVTSITGKEGRLRARIRQGRAAKWRQMLAESGVKRIDGYIQKFKKAKRKPRLTEINIPKVSMFPQ